jgi:3-phenylpropionate/trans-cinnamate dioxygenase ferredoxin reductase subunit
VGATIVERAVETFKASGRIVIVGASLAGLRAAETLRRESFDGELIVIGDEACAPYDRPPLSKQVLTGWVPADHTLLARSAPLDGVEWRLGVPAVHLDRAAKQVHLADGRLVDFDRVLIATGVRSRPWPNEAEAAFDGVFVVRTQQDAQRLRDRLAERPRRVLVIGAGFTGSEIASVCRQLDLQVTVAERGSSPLVGALGGVIGDVAAKMQVEGGVDLRVGVTVEKLEADGQGRLRGALLSDGDNLEADVAVVALGAIRNTEWLAASGLAAGPLGVACDTGCRVMDLNGVVSDSVFVAGDVARFPHPLYEYQLLALEHWSNALVQGETAAHNMLSPESARRAHIAVPSFWSMQFGVNIKSVGVPSFGEEIVVTQGSVDDRRFVAAYGHAGRIVAAVTFNHGRWLEFYQSAIASAAPFPPELHGFDEPSPAQVVPASFPPPVGVDHGPSVILTGHAPDELRIRRTAVDGAAS